MRNYNNIVKKMSLLRYFLAVCGDFVNFFVENGTFHSPFMEKICIFPTCKNGMKFVFK